jgi:hypothetical protein
MGTKLDRVGGVAGWVVEEDKRTLGLMLEDKEPLSSMVVAPGARGVEAPAVWINMSETVGSLSFWDTYHGDGGLDGRSDCYHSSTCRAGGGGTFTSH